MTSLFMSIKSNMSNQGISDVTSVLIRVDATKEVALGHLKRCVSLAYKLREKGVRVLFLVAKDDFTERFLRTAGFDYTVVKSETNSDADCVYALELAERLNAKIIIIDSYEIDATYRNKLIDSGFFVVSIDDTADKDLPSHIIINGNLNAEMLNYTDNGRISLYLGIRYLLLGPNFLDIINAKAIDDFSNVLITMGGIDHYDLTSKILSILDKSDADFDVTAIVGPYYENLASIQSQIAKMTKKVQLVNSPSTLYPYMVKCSMAFSAGGQTLYELAALGCPTIGITLWENQSGNVSALSKMGAIEGIIYSNDMNFDHVLKKSSLKLIYDKTERQRLSEIASAIVDGKGTERVSSAIIESYGKWNVKKEKK